MRYRRKSFDITAIKWEGGDTACLDDFVGLHGWTRADVHDIPWDHPDKDQIIIYNEVEKTWIPLPCGFYLIRGIRGEHYPCRADIFEDSYYPVST